ncbi:signal transduction histidine kinase [Angulomicrobium tetraedrale]|uniref:histidine kinase n=1 Tax=Ancylobacter tetraedralis TaxID=217068 RepID=A0A839Z4B6_9HYPH|nr:ATP-binding protein [Ancylobacter tetraedralis]MBB3769823.1 signal transduction histidine kinase [Ancylobacter tetraedralis]
MRVGSLALRLFASATLVSVAVLLVTGLALSSIYRDAVERAFDQRLDVYLKTIVADVANSTTGAMPEPTTLGDPIFNFPISGWYWQIARVDRPAREFKTSRSLPEGRLPLLYEQGTSADLTGLREAYGKGPSNQTLRIVERTVDLGEDGRYVAAVAADAAEIEEEVEGFNRALAITLAVIGMAFLLTLAFQVLFGLRPLKRLLDALHQVRTGKTDRLEGAYPQEIAPLAAEVNALIDANREIVERARTHVGNLAHALKTPLSVLQNEAARTASLHPDDALAAKVAEQAAIMTGQVAHHLERARMAARVTVATTVEEVGPIVEKLAATLAKVYRARGIAVEAEVAAGMRFRGERQDLEEILGNLVDNGCKWARSLVEVSVTPLPGTGGQRDFFEIVIDDDGPGLTPEQQAEALKRGRRLDETKPGSGLGLSIVAELAALYGGKLAFDRSPFGGLRCIVRLPAA